MKIVYQTDANGFYVGPVEADESPIEQGIFLIPGGCVELAPPGVGVNQIARWLGENWSIVPDFRGFKYWTEDRQQIEITEIGEVPPSGYLTEDPGPTPEQISHTLKMGAQFLLDKSDKTIGRCYEAGVPVPDAWKVYRAELRAIVSTGLGSLPNRPEYPAGT